MDIEFNNAVKNVKEINMDNVSDNDKLLLYGYYKQAIVGNIDIPKPSFWNRKAVAKWNAWNKCSGISLEDAKKKYIDIVNKLV